MAHNSATTAAITRIFARKINKTTPELSLNSHPHRMFSALLAKVSHDGGGVTVSSSPPPLPYGFMLDFTASTNCFIEKGLGRKANSSPSGMFLAKASSA